MIRSLVVLLSLIAASSLSSSAQSPTSDPQALAIIAKSVTALTGGSTIGGVTLHANAIWIAGSDYFTGPATLQATGTTDSRVDLTLNGLTRTEIRTLSDGVPSGSWISESASPQPYSFQNTWTDAVWFFPALSSLTQTANLNFLFSYIGAEQHGGVSVQHIRGFQLSPQADPKNLLNIQRFSATDFYLDSYSFLPLAIAFKLHPDNDMNTDVPIEIRFANYQPVSGVQVPFHVQESLNGGIVLDLNLTNAVVSSAPSIVAVRGR